MIYTRRTAQGRVVYWYRVWVDGREYRRSTKQGSLRAAQRAEEDFRTRQREINRGARPPERKVPLLKHAAAQYLEDASARVRPSTRRMYAGSVAALLGSALGSRRLDEITPAAVADYVRERRTSGRSEGPTGKRYSVTSELRVLRVILRQAVEHGQLQAVPTFKGPGGLQARSYVPDVKTLGRYLAGAPPVLRDLGLLMATTGLRIGECMSLAGSMIATEGKHLVIRLAEAKTDKSLGPVYVAHPAAIAILKRRRSEGLIFPEVTGSTRQRRVMNVDQLHKSTRERLHLPKLFILHSFRHLYISAAARNEKNPAVIKELARHVSIQTTMRYLHSLGEDVKQAALAVDFKGLLPEVTL
jgi:integrase